MNKTASWYSKALQRLSRRIGLPYTKRIADSLLRKYNFADRLGDYAVPKSIRYDYSQLPVSQLWDEIKQLHGSDEYVRLLSKDRLKDLFKTIRRENPPDHISNIAKDLRWGNYTPREKFVLPKSVKDPIGAAAGGKDLARLLGKLTPADFTEKSVRDFAKEYGTDFIFKGQGTIGGSDIIANSGGRSSQWWTRNPFVAAGYSGYGGPMLLLPNRGAVRRLVHSRATPHIATDDPAKILLANQVAKKGLPLGPEFDFARVYLDTPASRAADYEIVTNRDFWNRHRNNVLQVFSKIKPHDSSFRGNFPVSHGFSGMLTNRDMLADSLIVPNQEANKLLRNTTWNDKTQEIFRDRLLSRFLYG